MEQLQWNSYGRTVTERAGTVTLEQLQCALEQLQWNSYGGTVRIMGAGTATLEQLHYCAVEHLRWNRYISRLNSYDGTVTDCAGTFTLEQPLDALGQLRWNSYDGTVTMEQ